MRGGWGDACGDWLHPFVCCNKKVRARQAAIFMPLCYFSLGQPSAGFFLESDFFTASCHLPSILRVAGFGPAVFSLVPPSLGLSSLIVCQSLSLCRFDCKLFSPVIQFTSIPNKIKLPKIAMEVFAADVVIVPMIPRLTRAKELSAVLVCTSPRAYSLACVKRSHDRRRIPCRCRCMRGSHRHDIRARGSTTCRIAAFRVLP